MLKLCSISELGNNGCKGFALGEKQIFAVRKNNAIYTYLNTCPHLGAPLNWQEDEFLDFDNELIQCSVHGALFLIESGECVSGPCVGDKLTPIASKIIDGIIYLIEEL